jgi:hypothetical protein
LHDLIAVEPTASDKRTAAAKQDDYNDTDDETCIALLGGLGWRGNRHFIHNFYSFVIGWTKNVV